MSNSVQLSYPHPDIALITLDVPDRSANMLSQNFHEQLNLQLDEIEQNDQVAAIIFYSAKSTFLVGADLKEIASILDEPDDVKQEFCRYGRETFQRLANCKPVTVAAIHGAVVGGGAELAIWCDYRIMTDDRRSQFGYPEVNIGLIPCWGGTVRTARLIGLEESLKLITTGKLVGPNEAKSLGIVDQTFSFDSLIEASIEFARSKADDVQSRRESLSKPLTVTPDQLESLRDQFSKSIQLETGGMNPANQTALELMLNSATASTDDALQQEADGVVPIFGGPVNKALLNFFFLNDAARKDTGLDNTSIKPVQISTVGVTGAGIMGEGIGAINLKRQKTFQLLDINEDNLKKCTESILADADSETKNLLKTTKELSDFNNCDLLIESIIENKEIKQQFYEKLEPTLKPTAILASNTSTIPITTLAEKLDSPQRFIGMHFFHPVRTMPLVELIRGDKTDDQTVATAVAYVKQLGKIPIVVNDGPGFLVNRLLFPYSNEACKLIDEGAQIREVDDVAVKFGMRIGPFTFFDSVGLDTAAYSAKTIYMNFYQRVAKAPILPALVKAKRFGIKTGKGFYSYENHTKTRQDDPTLLDVIGKYLPENPKTFSEEEIIDRLLLPTLVEATLIIEEGIVRKPEDIDLGLILGLGFPKFKGLLYWADEIGPKEILERLKPFEELGPRFQATQLMKDLAQTNGRYYNTLN